MTSIVSLDSLRARIKNGAALSTRDLLEFFVAGSYGCCQAFGVRVEAGTGGGQCPLGSEIRDLLGHPVLAVKFSCSHYKTGTCPIAEEFETAALEAIE